MIESVTVYKDDATQLPITMDGSEKFIVKNIDGLGPVPTTSLYSGYVDRDGGFYAGGYAAPREIALTIGFKPGYAAGESVSSLRRELYKYLPREGPVEIRIVGDRLPPVKAVGYVTKLESAIFSKDPDLVATIVCPDPYLSALTATSLVLSTANGNLTLLGTSTAPTGYRITANYEGEVPTGFKFQTKDVAAQSGTWLWKLVYTSNTSIGLNNISYTMPTNSYFRLDSNRGAKTIETYDPASTLWVPMNTGISPTSTWPLINPGQNQFDYVETNNAAAYKNLPDTMSWVAKYLGL